MTGKQQTVTPPLRWYRTLDRIDVLGAAALITLYVIVAVLPIAPKKFGDMDFHVEARQIALAFHGAAPWHEVAITKAPAPVIYYLVPYLFVPPGGPEDTYWLAGFLWNLCWMMLSLLLLRRVGDALGGPKAGYLAVLLSLASPFNVYYSYGIVAEPAAYLGVCLALYGWIRVHRAQREGASQKSARALLWGGLAFFVLSRPNSILLLGLMLAAALVLWRKQTPESRALARITMLSAVVTGVVGLTVLSLASLLPGRPGEGQQAGYLAHVMFHGRFQYRTEPWDWRFWGAPQRQGSEDYAAYERLRDSFERQAEETGRSLAELKQTWVFNDWIEHPEVTLQAAAVRLLSLHVSIVNSKTPESFQVGPISGRLVYGLFHAGVNAVNALLLLGALWFLIRRRRQLATYWVLWGPWLALLVFHALIYAEPRYLFPARPGMVVMAAVVIAGIWARRSKTPHRAEVAS